MLAGFYMVTGPAAVAFYVLVLEERFGLRPDAPVPAGLGLAFALLIGVAGPLVSVAARIAAILMRRHWREALPLWFLAAGAGLSWIAVHSLHGVEGERLEKYAFLLLFLHGLTATWVGYSGVVSRLLSR